MAQWERARLEAEAKLVRESRRQFGSSSSSVPPPPPVRNRNAGVAHVTKPPCLDVLKAWQRVVTGLFTFNTTDNSLQSPIPCVGFNNNDGFVGNSNVSQGSNGMLGCSSENAWWVENAMEWEGYPAETLMVCNAVNHNQHGPTMEATGFEEDNNYWNNILDLANVSPSGNSFLFRQTKGMGLQETEVGNKERLRQTKLEMLKSWLPLLCRASTGIGMPWLSTSESAELGKILEDAIDILQHDEQEQVVSLWLHHFTYSPSTDWPNLHGPYARWCATSRKLVS
ncbi:hypothetical protein GQ457_06G003420 [Hibiscus cannabinus]